MTFSSCSTFHLFYVVIYIYVAREVWTEAKVNLRFMGSS